MNNRYRPVILAALLLLFVCLLSGCGAQPTTQMTVGDGFAGRRVMTCSVPSGKMEQLSGGEPALDALLQQKCPDPLTWEKKGQGNSLQYLFTLSFSSESDYRDKIESLLGREAYLLYAAPDGLFTQGVRLEEDFSSGDLMAWLDRALVDGGLCGQQPGLYSDGPAQVTLGERVYSSSQRLEIRDFTYYPVNKVSVTTRMLEGEQFARTISFSIPQSTCDLLGDKVDPYLRGLVPAGGEASWTQTAVGKTFTISFTARDNDQLASYTAQALDSSSSQSVMEQERDTLFNSQVEFTERLNFSSFLSNRYGKTYVEYRFTADSTSGVSDAMLWKSGRWMQVDGYLEPDGFLFQDDSALMQVRLQSRNEFSVSDVKIGMNRLPDGSFRRDILLDFSGDTGMRGAATASRYFTRLEIPGLSASAEGSRCTLSMSGAASEINEALGLLFGPGNAVSLGAEEGFQLYHSATVEDQIDLREFLQQIGYQGTVKYSYTGDSPVTALNQAEGDGTQPLRADSNTIARTLPADGKAVLTAVVQWANAGFVWMLCGAGLACLGLALLLLLLARRHAVRRREASRPCPAEAFAPLGEPCPSCGAPLYRGMLFCTQCRQPVPEYEDTAFAFQSSDQVEEEGAPL